MHVPVHVGRIGMSDVMGGKAAHERDLEVAAAIHLTVEKTCVVG